MIPKALVTIFLSLRLPYQGAVSSEVGNGVVQEINELGGQVDVIPNPPSGLAIPEQLVRTEPLDQVFFKPDPKADLRSVDFEGYHAGRWNESTLLDGTFQLEHLDSDQLNVYNLTTEFPPLPHPIPPATHALSPYPGGQSMFLTNETITTTKFLYDVYLQLGYIVNDKLQAGQLDVTTSYINTTGLFTGTYRYNLGSYWGKYHIGLGTRLNTIKFTVANGAPYGVLAISRIWFKVSD